ncbi:hypothetical protein ASZ90_017244 [hydrocarbon metagenome]|uniref:Uncharacterized protein n=1 Tax=hydrocarbon metagenome TaxID=938273 RepID=A0A0W8E9M3_9ZZZZ
MKQWNWFMFLGVCFLGGSFAIYSLHYMIFGDSHFIFKYLVAQLGFLPINVFLVTIVLNKLMSRRDKRARLQKLNMIIGAFFSDLGSDLLRHLSWYDQNLDHNRENLVPTNNWSNQDFTQARKNIAKLDFKLNLRENSLQSLHDYLSDKRPQLLAFLENPTLLEHEHFTDLIWAVFHLQDELALRPDLYNLSELDTAHLSEDLRRVSQLLIMQWMDHMQHLQSSYPHLYSLALRTNPFDTEARVEIS